MVFTHDLQLPALTLQGMVRKLGIIDYLFRKAFVRSDSDVGQANQAHTLHCY